MPNLKFSQGVKLSLTFLMLLVRVGVSFGQTEKNLDSLFSTLARQGYLNGCVLVAEGGKPVYEKAFGYADFDTKQPLTNQTMFELASVSKQFTAMAIMQLHQQGKLKYTDSLKKFFPDIPYHGITISHLLHHTSGIPEFLAWNANYIDVNRINDNKDILNAIITKQPRLNFKPGDTLSYSNTNYVLLALIVEKVSGLSFSSYLDKNIFKPLGMNHTRVYPQRSVKQKIADYAYGYLYNPAKNKFEINDNIEANRYEYYFDGVAGPYGISSSTEDLLKWDQALYTEKLVKKDIQAEAYLPVKQNNGAEATFAGIPYGFGWLILPKKEVEGRRYLHSGGYPGYMTMISRYPDHNKTIILLINTYNVIDVYKLTAAVEHILFGKPFTIPTPLPFQKSITLTPAQLKAIEGTYVVKAAQNLKFFITAENGQVYAQIQGQPKAEIYAEDELDFFYTIVAAKIKFSKDVAGNINQLTLQQNGQKLEALKVAGN